MFIAEDNYSTLQFAAALFEPPKHQAFLEIATLLPSSHECSTMTTVDSFAHRRNRDASIDSICRTCYRTVASADSESKLIPVEESHSCDLTHLAIRAIQAEYLMTRFEDTSTGYGAMQTDLSQLNSLRLLISS